MDNKELLMNLLDELIQKMDEHTASGMKEMPEDTMKDKMEDAMNPSEDKMDMNEASEDMEGEPTVKVEEKEIKLPTEHRMIARLKKK